METENKSLLVTLHFTLLFKVCPVSSLGEVESRWIIFEPNSNDSNGVLSARWNLSCKVKIHDQKRMQIH